jgi:hypothetical protein
MQTKSEPRKRQLASFEPGPPHCLLPLTTAAFGRTETHAQHSAMTASNQLSAIKDPAENYRGRPVAAGQSDFADVIYAAKSGHSGLLATGRYRIQFERITFPKADALTSWSSAADEGGRLQW